MHLSPWTPGPQPAPRGQQAIAAALFVNACVSASVAVLSERYPPGRGVLFFAAVLAGGFLAAALPGQVGLKVSAGRRYWRELGRRVLSALLYLASWSGVATACAVIGAADVRILDGDLDVIPVVGVAASWGSLLGGIGGSVAWIARQVHKDRARLTAGAEIHSSIRKSPGGPSAIV